MPHTENSEAFSSPLLEKRTYLHLSEADVDQLRNRLHPTNDTNSTASTHLQQQATDDNELDEEEASGSVSVEPEDVREYHRFALTFLCSIFFLITHLFINHLLKKKA